MRLGRVGLWSAAPVRKPAAETSVALEEIEALGYSAVWFPETAAFTQSALMLSWTRGLAVCPGIASIYARDAYDTANSTAALADAYPGRFVLGLGVSHRPAVEMRGHEYRGPWTAMSEYLDALDAVDPLAPAPAERPLRILAALGPRMLRLAAQRADGAHPYFVPVEHTALARETLGAGPLLCVEQAVALETDASTARARAREFTPRYLALENYRNNLLRLGFAASDLEGGGSDLLVDAVVAWGGLDAVVGRVREHFDAGADHVCIQPLPSGEFCLDQLRELAPAVREL